MISERRLASSFTSFWQDLLPAGAALVRRMNMNKERFCPPLDSQVDPTRRAFVNEAGYVLFKTSEESGLPPEEVHGGGETFRKICDYAWNSIQGSHRFMAPGSAELGEAESSEVLELARRLRDFFQEHGTGNPIGFWPQFAGCGFVDDCQGDILSGNTLYEVKGGERTFRLIDIRQILVYLALNMAAPCYEINQVILMNPRRGTYYKFQIDELAFSVSGKSSVELLSDIIHFVSSGDLSR
jgi:hypothetical protein